MTQPVFNRATHFSIVWAMVLAILTLVEWNSLDRDPMTEQIFLPFIDREIELVMTDANTANELGATAGDLPSPSGGRKLQTQVRIDFNGPLFLAYFFGPIMIFHAFSLLWRQLARGT